MTSALLVIIVAFAIFATACSGGGEEETAPPGLTPLATDVYESRLAPEVWQRVLDASWYHAEAATPAGKRMLEVMTGGGPLWRASDSLALLEAYPQGIDDATWSAAQRYARLALLTVHEVILAPWLVDGVDDYELAVLDAVRDRVVSITSLRRALDDGFFRDAYEADPDSLGPIEIDAIGSLQPRMLQILREEGWFTDGISQYEASLLGILNSLLAVEEQLAILESGDHRPVELGSRTIAVVYLGNEPELLETAHAIIEEWMPRVEDFAGEFTPVGLVVELERIPGAGGCHAAGNVGIRPGRIALPLDFCFEPPVLIHELAHAFIGGRYPVWFTEGVAELVSYHLTGTRSGYLGGEGLIQIESNALVFTPAYYNQGALGAEFLATLYDFAGEEAMSEFVTAVATRNLSGEVLLGYIRDLDVEDRTGLEALIRDAFGPTALGR